MKKLLRIIILILVLWGFPTFALFYINATLGSLTSYLTIVLLLVYYAFYIKNYRKPLLCFIFLGITYYALGGLNFSEPLYNKEYLTLFIKYIIVVLCSTEIAKDSNIKEIYYILIFGALSVIIHAVVFPNIDAHFGESYGRFSGFYLNPNYAAIINLVGFSLSFGIKSNARLKLIGQLVFSFSGILTMSRYFILIWVLINIVASITSRKNLMAPILGAIVIAFVILSGAIKLHASRLEALESIFSDEQVKTETINHDNRQDTWATFADIIMEKPFLGNGYRQLQGGNPDVPVGVHNTYLLVLGEAGIIPLAFLLWIVFFLIFKSLLYYKYNMYYIFLAMVIATSFLVSHTYFEKFSNIFITIFLYLKLLDARDEQPKLKNTHE